ncbi:type II secretion system major pseudopilin GspG [Roseimicrobium sp. ORNL1]|uniref:type II secretion system major pseudopilin GspG n=1 Tax=Roseimicrobium sp. ORNL1 TaxID=2711231 RepID=UPI0013E1DCC8|nr:type II secretion system major pseudopilin GspG [Roseimicrobium sp. ORNL1]QIF05350.1 type II secretion system major pseudopilin GspG [Roseimicrobium sp. ORNL1]
MKISSHATRSQARFGADTAGFTLMEMMLVLLIISLIIGGAALMFQNITASAEKNTTKAKVRSLEASLVSYRLDNGGYPTQAQGLDALVSQPTVAPQPRQWKQLVKSDGIVDPWQRKMGYRNPGKHNPSGVDVYSFGEDGLDGTQDDLGNW